MATGVSDALVMIVDDMVDNLKLLQSLLNNNGYKTAVFPKAALALHALELGLLPELILLDINMPEMNGFQLCRALKANPSLRDIPVIFLSAMTDLDDKLKAFESGGIDYIAKPFQFDEALARVGTHVKLRRQTLELERSNAQLKQMEQSLEQLVVERTEQLTASNAQLKDSQSKLHLLNLNLEQKVNDRTLKLSRAIEALRDSVRSLRQDEEAGRLVQFKLLPEANKHFGNLTCRNYLKPSLYMSGDFVDYFAVDENNIVFYFADVSGHGAAPAFVTFLMRSFVNNSLANYWNKHDKMILDPAALLQEFNKSFLGEKLDHFITMFYGVIALDQNKLFYSNAGHFPFPIISVDDVVHQIVCKAPPIGMFDFSCYSNNELTLPKAFSLYIFSDGVLEIIAQKAIKEQLGFLERIVLDCKSNMEKVIEILDIKKHMPLQDDITILNISRG